MKKTASRLSTRSKLVDTRIIVGVVIGVITILIVLSAYILQFGSVRANTIAAVQDPRFASLTAGTTMMNEVPTVLSSQGVTINNQFVIRPLTSAQKQTSMITVKQAITIGRTYADAHPFKATTLLGSFTNLGSIPPPGATDKANVIQNVPAWVVTFTTTDPQNVIIGKKPAPGKASPYLAPTHFNIVINASTGAFVLGFFTM